MNTNENSTQENDKYADFYKNKELFYTFDPEKGYSKVQDLHPETDRLFIIQSWETYAERTEEARQKFHAGEASPVLYHMERMTLEIPALAQMTGIAKWRVKRHLRPEVYRKLKQSVLERYAKVFKLSIDTLDKID